jgi:NAD-dependent oxidoreductase involved in siderophore biosynthesis
VLAPAELEALEQLSDASPEELRAAAARMPRYQRSALCWLARELELAQVPTLADAQAFPVSTAASEREAALARALLERSRLEREIATSSATTEQKAFMQQALAHLWRRVHEAVGAPCARR